MRVFYVWASLLWSLMVTTSAWAAAGNGRAGLVWPGARMVTPGTAEIGVGTGFTVPVDEEMQEILPPFATHSFDVNWSPSKRLVLEAQWLGNPPGFNLAFASARYTAWQSKRLALAPWFAVGMVGPAENTGTDFLVLPGFALEYGGEKVRFDVSTPIIGLLASRRPVMALPGVFMPEIGVTWHPSKNTSLRGGIALFFPTLRWRHELGHFFYEVDIASVGVGIYQLRGGWRFY